MIYYDLPHDFISRDLISVLRDALSITINIQLMLLINDLPHATFFSPILLLKNTSRNFVLSVPNAFTVNTIPYLMDKFLLPSSRNVRQEKIILKFILNLNMKEYVLPVTNVGIRR